MLSGERKKESLSSSLILGQGVFSGKCWRVKGAQVECFSSFYFSFSDFFRLLFLPLPFDLLLFPFLSHSRWNMLYGDKKKRINLL